jgi:hypothetical protein
MRELCYVFIKMVPSNLFLDTDPHTYPTMSVKQFYLLGEPSASARNVELESTLDYAGIQLWIAGQFAIVEPSGMFSC